MQCDCNSHLHVCHGLLLRWIPRLGDCFDVYSYFYITKSLNIDLVHICPPSLLFFRIFFFTCRHTDFLFRTHRDALSIAMSNKEEKFRDDDEVEFLYHYPELVMRENYGNETRSYDPDIKYVTAPIGRFSLI